MITLTRRSERARYATRGGWWRARVVDLDRERGGSLEQRALTLLGPFEEGASYVGFTGFVGPTGAILDLDNEDTGHEALARTLGVSVADLVQAGFVRVDKHSFLNVEVHGSLNRAQIVALNRIAEPLDHLEEADIDVVADDGSLIRNRAVAPVTKSNLARLWREANGA